MNNIKRIIVFGCSYASGEELLYDELENELLSIRENKDPREFFKAIENNQEYQKRYNDIIKRQYELAWPKTLSDMLGVECINFSESGNSMQRMLWQFLNYRNDINNTDLVIFSQTKSDRNLFFKNRPTSFQISSLLDTKKSGIIGVGKNGNADIVVDEVFDKVIVKWFTDDRIVWDEIMVLLSLGYLQKFYNIKIIPTMKSSEYILQDYNKNLFHNIFEIVYNDLQIGNKSIDEFKGSDGNLLWGHPTLEVHNKFADYLYKEIKGVYI